MNTLSKLSLLFVVLLTLGSCKNEQNSPSQDIPSEQPQRLVSLNGTITEIISALGYQDQIVAVDVTSVYPEDLNNAANLGHVMNLSIEGLLQTKPTQIFALKSDLSADVQQKLGQLEIPVHYYDHKYSAQGTKELIKSVASDLGAENTEPLFSRIDQELKDLKEFENKPKVMYIYARGAGTVLVAGSETPAAKIIELAGGTNVVTQYEDYRPLTTEAVAKANPDVLLLFDTGLQSLDGMQGLKEIPGLSATTAVKQGQVIAMDGLYLTGFGPRMGAAAKELNKALGKYAQ